MKGISISLTIRIFGVGTGYLFTFLIAKYYGASVMGSFALSQTILMITVIMAKLGLDTASVRFISEHYSKKNYITLKVIYFMILKMVIPLSIILSIGLYIISPFLANLMHKPDMEGLFKVTSIGVLPLSLLFIHSESFRGMKKILIYSLFRNMTTQLVGSIILLIFFYFDFKMKIIPLYAYLISICILSFIAAIIWKFQFRELSLKANNSRIKFRNLLKVSFPMLMTSSMAYIINWVGVFILGIYNSESDIGVYNIAMKLSMLTNISLFAVNSIAAPKFAELFANKNMIGFNQTVYQSSKLIFFTTIPIILILLIFPTYLLGIFGDEYEKGKWVLIFLTIGQFINSISGSTGYILQMTGYQKIFQNIIFFSAVINIFMNIILVPSLGIFGASISSMICIIIWNFLSVFIIYKKFNIITVYFPNFISRKFV